MKKNGTIKDGRRQRRGNGAGTLFKARGIYYMRFNVIDAITGKPRKVAFSTHLPDTDLEGARDMLDKKARELGFAEKGQAEILLDRAHNDQNAREKAERERAEKERAEIEAQAKIDAEAQARAELLERDSKAITLLSAFSYYRASKRKPDSGEATLKMYESQFETFSKWMGENFPKAEKMRDVTPKMTEAFLDHLEKSRSHNTRNKYLVFLRTLWRVLRWEPDAQLTIDPWDGIKNLVEKTDEVTRKELTVEELRRVVAVIRSNEPLTILPDFQTSRGIKDVFAFNGVDIRAELLVLFAVGIFTGLRLGDCATLSWGDVDLARGIIDTMPRKTKRKYKRRVIIPIHPALGQLLNSVDAKGKGHVVPTLATMYLDHNSSLLTSRIQAIFQAAQIVTTAEAQGTRARVQVGFHSLRHTFASIMLNAGAPFAFVEKMLGHSQQSMTAHYYHENAESLRRAVAKLPLLAMTDNAQSIQNAATDAPLVEATATAAEVTDAPHGIVEAIRAHLGGASGEELQEALEIIQNAISRRSEERS